jgi:hypothetical protein
MSYHIIRRQAMAAAGGSEMAPQALGIARIWLENLKPCG